MKHIIIFFVYLTCILSSSAQQIYFYYNGCKVIKDASPNHLLVYFDKYADIKSITTQYQVFNVQQNTEKGSAVGFSCEIFVPSNGHDNVVQSLKANSNVLYIEPAIGDEPIFSSRFFYVQLKEMEDYEVLLQEAKKIGAEVIREVPYADNWFSLSGEARSVRTSIELSNLMWETGMFRNVDPGFIPQVIFNSSCVSDLKYDSHQWNMHRINACDAWEITTGDPSVRVAVIDRGMRLDHVELDGLNLVYSIDLRPENPSSPSVCYCDNIPYLPPNCHGAHVGGILFSDHNQNEIAGISPTVSALDFSIGLVDSHDDIPKFAAAIFGAVSQGARIINNSWGLTGDGDSLYILLDGALEFAKQSNVLLVFSAGNDAPNMGFPAASNRNILAVGASTQADRRAEFSSYGPALDIVAPGVDILSAWGTSNTAYHIMEGTSMAAPLVSGVAALMLSVRPELNAMQVHDIINATAQKVNPSIYPYTDDPDHPNGTWNEEMGYGLLDAYAAVRMAQTYDGVSDLMIRDHEHAKRPIFTVVSWCK